MNRWLLGWADSPLITMLRLVLLFLLAASVAQADPPEFQKYLRPRLIFEPNRDNPQLLEVYLHLDNIGYQDAKWTTDAIGDLEASLTDKQGRPVPPPGPADAEITSGPSTFTLPAGSRLDWRLTFHFGISTTDPKPDEYQIQIGSGVWNVSKDKMGTYVLKVRLSGWAGVLPDISNSAFRKAHETVLFDLPPQKIVVTAPSPD